MKEGQIFYKGNAVSSIKKIVAMYNSMPNSDEYVTINFEGFGGGSFPYCKRLNNNTFLIGNGFKCDKIKIYK